MKRFHVRYRETGENPVWEVDATWPPGRERHRFPAEFRAFDSGPIFRRSENDCTILFISDALQMLVAVDWLMERDWELDLSRCDAAFLSVYPVTAEATA
jgi:hypothetical protein